MEEAGETEAVLRVDTGGRVLTDAISGSGTEGNESVGMSSGALIGVEAIRVESQGVGKEFRVAMMGH